MASKLDYCPTLHALADRITNVNRVHGDFGEMHERHDNEYKLSVLSSELAKVLEERKIVLTSDIGENLHARLGRKITLFLIVNTRVDLPYDLQDDFHIKTCLNKCTKITQCVLMHLIWSLKLEEYFYEAIALTPFWLSRALLDAAFQNMYYLESYDIIKKSQRLVEVMYHQITRLQFIEMDDHERSIILSGFVKIFIPFLKYFISPPSIDMENWSENELMRYVGRCLQSVLEMTLYCTKKSLKVTTKKVPKMLRIYNIDIKNVPYKQTDCLTQDRKFHPSIANTLSLLNTNLFNTCAANIKTITMTMFIYWYEIEEDDCEDNLQYIISSLSYELQELMTANDFKHELFSLLQNFAKKPKTLKEKVRDAPIETVIRCINMKNENQSVWFGKLVENNGLFTNTVIRKVLEKNVMLVDENNIKVILQKLVDTLTYCTIKIEPDEREVMKQLFLKLLKSLRSVDIQIRTVQGFLIQNGATKVLQTDDFDKKLNIVFNKTIVMDNYKLTQMLELVIQNAERVYSKTLECCIKNSRQIDLMCTMLQKFKVIGQIRFHPITYELSSQKDPMESANLFMTTLISTFKNIVIEENDSKNFVKFIQNIKNMIESVEKLYSNFFMPAVQEAVKKKDSEKLLCLLKAVNLICDDKYISHFYAPSLVIMAQVLEYARWDLLTFENIKVQIVIIVIANIQKIGKEFLKVSEDKLVQWLRIKLNKIRTINKIHFKCILDGQRENNELVWKPIFEPQRFESRKETVAYLCEFMSRMVPSELKLLKLEDPELIFDTIKAITYVVADHKEKEAALGLMVHHFKLSAFLLKDKVPFDEPNDNIKYFLTLLKILTNVPLESRENCCLAVINILTTLLNTIIKYKLSEAMATKFEKEILKLDCVETQGILIKMLCLSKDGKTSEVLADSTIKQEIDLALKKDESDDSMDL